MILAEKIRESLAESGLTRKEFAEKAEIGLSTLNGILNGKIPNPTYFTVMKIAQVGHISLDEIGGLTSKNMGEEEIERVRKEYEKNQAEIEKALAEYSSKIAHKEETEAHDKEIIRRQDLRMREQLERIAYQMKAIRWLRIALGSAIIIIFALVYYILILLGII